MIRFEKIKKNFQYHFWDKGFLALDDINFEICSGDLVGFLGANGAGKTTLIKILMNFIKADSGNVTFSTDLGTTAKEFRKNTGYLPEKAYLYPHLTGREFLTYSGVLNDLKLSELNPLILKWAETMQITHAMDRHIHTYSKGMQQRLGFISALIHSPKFIVLDEPLSGLDPIGRKEFKTILQNLNAQGVTIFFSSHVVADVEEICNKVVFIEKGKLIYEGSIDELIHKNSNDDYRIKYFVGEQLNIVKVQSAEKDNFIKNLINSGSQIVELEKEKPSLEEIIYKIKQ
jgi:ABC-2 type transport system ATP-binding protein